jgi:hypothetical protein
MQEANWPLRTCFICLANTTSVAMFIYLWPKFGPPISLTDVVCRLLGTKVSKDGVGLFYDYSCKALVPSNYSGDAEDFVSSVIVCI